MKNQYGIAWDYEESKTSYYHIYSYDGAIDELLSSITIDIEQTEENTADIEIIVSALRRIAQRLEKKNEHEQICKN
jgi:hypothetical protein